MSENLIIAENVSKKFCKDLNRGLWYGIQDLKDGFLGKSQHKKLRKSEFWAVDDISFELKRGECLGLLGHNGAGKSTLLKVLNGLLLPDKGRIEMRGRVNALIELGAGFNPILTGRENIFNNAAVLGLSTKEVKGKLDEIIEFSELEEFIDTPVQYYSSGMKVRLGFSVAAHLEPDVLILDEVLAVGDAGFRIKSFNKMMEIMKSSAVIFVSHSMPTVARVCNKVLFMNHGKEYYLGNDVHKGIELYFDEFESEQAQIENNEKAQMQNFRINGEIADWEIAKKSPVFVNYGEDLVLEFEVNISDISCKEFLIGMSITDKDLKIVANFFTHKFTGTFKTQDVNDLKIVFPKLLLIDGEYAFTYQIIAPKEQGNQYEILATYRNYTKFKVRGLQENIYSAIFLKGDVYQNGKLLTS